MRILAYTNGYPPHHVGGYEIGCRDVVDALRARGHDVRVLTSVAGFGTPRAEGHVLRFLRLDPIHHARTPLSRLMRPLRVVPLIRKERYNQRLIRRVLGEVAPDVVYIWNPLQTSMSVAAIAAELGIPVAYFVSDEWMARYPAEELWLQLLRGGFLPRPVHAAAGPVLAGLARALGMVPGDAGGTFRHAQFASAYLERRVRESGKALEDSSVIHWGIDPGRFQFRAASGRPPRRLLFVGQVAPHKGVHVVVEAVRLLRDEHGFADVTLDIVGGHSPPGYLEQLHASVRTHRLEDQVRFRGIVARETLPAVYAEHDVLVFASTWQEPFSITLLEGLACGLAVVGTTTGGSPEILAHDSNALTYAAEDPADCAARLADLLRDPGRYEAIRAAGRRTVETGFTFAGMVDRVEEALDRCRR